MGTRGPLGAAMLVLGSAGLIDAARAQAFDVKQPEVEAGELLLSQTNTLHAGLPRHLGSDVNRSAHELGLDYGLSSWWKLTGVLKFERPEQEDLRLANAAIESIFLLKGTDDKRTRDFGLAWFTGVDITTHRDSTNAVVFGPIAKLKSDKLTFTVNPFFEKTFGRNRDEGVAFVYAWQIKQELRDGFGIGVEGYGTVDNIAHPPPVAEQEHRIGPVVYTEVELRKDFKLTPEFGVLFGLTEATPDVTFKLNVGVPLYSAARRNGDG
jgi:hypothetical protein